MGARVYYQELVRKIQAEGMVRAGIVLSGARKGEHYFGQAEGSGEVFEEVLLGSPQVVILGGGHISMALSKILKVLDYGTIVVDDRAEFANRERFPEAREVIAEDFGKVLESRRFGPQVSYVIVTRGHEHDYQCLRQILKGNNSYVGMIGSKKKVGTTFERLRADGVSEEVIRSIHAPIGLKIGGRTPAEIALSIAAELVQVNSQREGGGVSEELIQGLQTEKGPMVLATVLEKSGSSPAGTGSRMLVTESGKSYGTIGGGSVEHAVIREARQKMGASFFEMRDYNLSNEGAASFGMICGGKIRVLLESL